MKRFLAAFPLAALLPGCADAQQRAWQTGRGVNLSPTRGETPAGY
jgi:hypothetical protein